MNVFIVMHEKAIRPKQERLHFATELDAIRYLDSLAPEQVVSGFTAYVAEIDGTNDTIICPKCGECELWWQIDGHGCADCGFDRIEGDN